MTLKKHEWEIIFGVFLGIVGIILILFFTGVFREKFEKDTQDNSVKNNERKEKQVLKKRLYSDVPGFNSLSTFANPAKTHPFPRAQKIFVPLSNFPR